MHARTETTTRFPRVRRAAFALLLLGCSKSEPRQMRGTVAPTMEPAVDAEAIAAPVATTSSAGPALSAAPALTVVDASSTSAPTAFEITLARSACYGVCPKYRVTIFADGRVVYDGDAFVKVHGRVVDHISAAEAQSLADTFDALGFTKLKVPKTCPTGIRTDHPTNQLMLVRGDRTHSVEHYTGNTCAPDALTKLADAVDVAAKTDRWTHCGAGAQFYCMKP